MPLRVLFVGNFLPASKGSRTVGEELASRLSAVGWQTLATSRETQRVRRLLDMVRTAWQRRQDFDVAHVDVYSGAAFVWAEAVCATLHAANKPYVLTLHGGNLPVFASRWPGRVSRLLRGARYVTTPSGYLREALRRHRSDLVLLPNAIDISTYPFRERRTLRPKLVWLRAFHSIYNPVLAVDVLAALAETNAGVELAMIGPDKADGSLDRTRARATQLGVEGRLNITGPVPKSEVPERLAEHDVFINTTNIDNAPVSVLEAMACGLCVVSTRVGGIPYLVQDGREALLVPAGDAASMAAAVRRLLTEPGLAASLSRNARTATEAADWATVLPLWEDLFAHAASSASTTQLVASRL